MYPVIKRVNMTHQCAQLWVRVAVCNLFFKFKNSNRLNQSII